MSRLERVTVGVVACAIVLLVTPVVFGWLVKRTIHGVLHNDRPACAGLGRPATPIPVEWSELRVAESPVADDAHLVAYRVSQPIDVVAGDHGVRIDAQVHGSANAPIFPDPVAIYLSADHDLRAALQQHAQARFEVQPPGPPTTTSPSPAVFRYVGSGVNGINENVALATGSYRLFSADSIERLGDVEIRICR